MSVQDVLPSDDCLLLCGLGQGRVVGCAWGPCWIVYGLQHRCVQEVGHVVIAFHFVVQCHEVQLCVSSGVFLFSVAASQEVVVVFAVMLAQHAVFGTGVLCLPVLAFSCGEPSHVELSQNPLVSQ